MNLEKAILKAKKLAEDKIIKHQNADELIEIAEAYGFKIYVAAGKDISTPSLEVCMRIRETFLCWCLKEK